MSALLDLRRLERRSRRLLGAGYLFAAAVLVLLALTWHAPPRVAFAPEKPGIHALRNIAGLELIPERNNQRSGVE